LARILTATAITTLTTLTLTTIAQLPEPSDDEGLDALADLDAIEPVAQGDDEPSLYQEAILARTELREREVAEAVAWAGAPTEKLLEIQPPLRSPAPVAYTRPSWRNYK